MQMVLAGKTVRIKISLETNLIEKISPRLVAGDSANIADNIKARLNVQRSNLLLVKKFNEGNETLNKTVFSNLDVMDLGAPTTYALAQNYPNPFNPTTTINYQIPKDGFVTLKIYDVLGKEVATLVNENKGTGRYNVNFNASNLASGVYLYQLKVNDFVSTKKLVLLK